MIAWRIGMRAVLDCDHRLAYAAWAVLALPEMKTGSTTEAKRTRMQRRRTAA